MNNKERAIDQIIEALDAAETRALEDVTLALDQATPLTNGADAPSRIAWLFARIEDAEADRDNERAQAINDCIAALNKLIDEIAGKEFHPEAKQVLFLARDALRALLGDTPAKKKPACVEHLWERQEDGFVRCINPGCGVSKEAYTTGSAKAKEHSV